MAEDVMGTEVSSKRGIEQELICWGETRWHLRRASQLALGESELATTKVILAGADRAKMAGNNQMALEMVDGAYQVIAFAESDMKGRFGKGMGLMEVGKRYVDLGRIDKAELMADLTGLLYFADNPRVNSLNAVELVVGLGDLYERTGAHDKATKYWQVAMDYKPESGARGQIRASVGRFFGQAGQREEVMKIVDELKVTDKKAAHELAVGLIKDQSFEIATEVIGAISGDFNAAEMLALAIDNGGSKAAVEYLSSHAEVIKDSGRDVVIKRLIWRGDIAGADKLSEIWHIEDDNMGIKALSLIKDDKVSEARKYAEDAVSKGNLRVSDVYENRARDLALQLVDEKRAFSEIRAMINFEMSQRKFSGATDAQTNEALGKIAEVVMKMGPEGAKLSLLVQLAKCTTHLDKERAQVFVNEAKSLMELPEWRNSKHWWMDIVEVEAELGVLKMQSEGLLKARECMEEGHEQKGEYAAELAMVYEKIGDRREAERMAEICATEASKVVNARGKGGSYKCMVYFGKYQEAEQLLAKTREDDRDEWMTMACVTLVEADRLDDAMGMGRLIQDRFGLRNVISRLARNGAQGVAMEMVKLELDTKSKWELGYVLARSGDFVDGVMIAKQVISERPEMVDFVFSNLLDTNMNESQLMDIWKVVPDVDKIRLERMVRQGGKEGILLADWMAKGGDENYQKAISVLAKLGRWKEATVLISRLSKDEEAEKAVEIIASTKALIEAKEYIEGTLAFRQQFGNESVDVTLYKEKLKREGKTPSDSVMLALVAGGAEKDIVEEFISLYPPEERVKQRKRWQVRSGEMTARLYSDVMPEEVVKFLGTTQAFDVNKYHEDWMMSGLWRKEWVFRRNILAAYKLETQRPGIMRQLKKDFNVVNIGRYPVDVLVNMMDHYTEGGNYGLMIAPCWDHNGAFYNDRDKWGELSNKLGEHNYRLIITEASTRLGIAKRIMTVGRDLGPSSFRIFGGHGNEMSMQYGTDDIHGIVSIRDFEEDSNTNRELRRVYYVPGSPAVFWACHAGNENGLAKAYSNRFEAPAYGPTTASGNFIKIEPRFSANDERVIGFDIQQNYSDTAEYQQGILNNVVTDSVK